MSLDLTLEEMDAADEDVADENVAAQNVPAAHVVINNHDSPIAVPSQPIARPMRPIGNRIAPVPSRPPHSAAMPPLRPSTDIVPCSQMAIDTASLSDATSSLFAAPIRLNIPTTSHFNNNSAPSPMPGNDDTSIGPIMLALSPGSSNARAAGVAAAPATMIAANTVPAPAAMALVVTAPDEAPGAAPGDDECRRAPPIAVLPCKRQSKHGLVVANKKQRKRGESPPPAAGTAAPVAAGSAIVPFRDVHGTYSAAPATMADEATTAANNAPVPVTMTAVVATAAIAPDETPGAAPGEDDDTDPSTALVTGAPDAITCNGDSSGSTKEKRRSARLLRQVDPDEASTMDLLPCKRQSTPGAVEAASKKRCKRGELPDSPTMLALPPSSPSSVPVGDTKAKAIPRPRRGKNSNV
jgi:hypothetical protein